MCGPALLGFARKQEEAVGIAVEVDNVVLVECRVDGQAIGGGSETPGISVYRSLANACLLEGC